MALRLLNASREEEVVRNARGDECGVSQLTLSVDYVFMSVNESYRGESEFAFCVCCVCVRHSKAATSIRAQFRSGVNLLRLSSCRDSSASCHHQCQI